MSYFKVVKGEYLGQPDMQDENFHKNKLNSKGFPVEYFRMNFFQFSSLTVKIFISGGWLDTRL